MKVYVVLYQDLWLNTCKVSQEGYKKLSEAIDFCKGRLGVQSWADLPSIVVRVPKVSGFLVILQLNNSTLL